MAIKAPRISLFRRGGKGGIFYAQVNSGTAFSLRTRERREAEDWQEMELAKLRRKALGLPPLPGDPAARAPLTFDETWSTYVRLPNVLTKARKTLTHEKECFEEFRDWCELHGVRLINEVVPETITEYRRDLLARPKKQGEGTLSRRSVNNYITHLSAVWYHLSGEERVYTGVNPFKSVRKLKENSSAPKDRPWSEVEEVVAEAELHGEDIHKAFVLTHLFGIRKVEMLRVRHSDVDWAERTITFHKSKPRVKSYTVHMPPEAVEELMKYRRPGNAYFVKPESDTWPEHVEYRWHFRKAWSAVFRSLNEKRAAEGRTTVEAFSPHQLRHTLITRLISLGWSLQDVAAFVIRMRSPSPRNTGNRARTYGANHFESTSLSLSPPAPNSTRHIILDSSSSSSGMGRDLALSANHFPSA